MSIEKKDCTMSFRCTAHEKKLILNNISNYGISNSDYILKCCLYGVPNDLHKDVLGFLTELDTLIVKLGNGSIKKKEFINLVQQKEDCIWSTLKL
jgi:hypothetical protein